MFQDTNNYQDQYDPAYEYPVDYDNQYNEYAEYPAEMASSNMSITLSWMVDAYIEEKRSLFKKIKDTVTRTPYEPKVTRILNGVRGLVKPGQLCAIMGASGAGKTTLLNTLNFRNRGNLMIEGDIRVNGKPVTLNEITKFSGYVQQDDLFIPTMTVKEHLSFLAFLKMGRYYTPEQKRARIEEIITQVNLAKCQDTYIGAGDRFKGISGGEKRRLAFASEIITNPSLLFCDEPTSGLDAFMALGLVEIMSEQVKAGKTIICTIHQPSTEIFEKFDTLCLLSEGRVAYFGPTPEAYQFFSSVGYVCPSTYNPADYYIQTLAIVPTSREESIAKSNYICDAFSQTQYQANIDYDLGLLSGESGYFDEFESDKGYAATVFEQIRWLTWRNFINDLRNPVATRILLFQVIFIGVFFGLIYLQIFLDETGARNTNGLLFVLMMNMGFIFLFPILNVFAAEVLIFYRDAKNRLYSTFIYYFTKQLSDLPKYIALAFLLITIIYWMANVRADAGVFFALSFTYVLSSQAGVGFGYFLSVVSSNVEVGSALAGPVLIPLILFSGFFLNNSSVPDYFIWLKYLSWFFYSYEAIQIELWTSVPAIICSNSTVTYTEAGVTAVCPNPACRNNGDEVLKEYNVDKGNLARDLIILGLLGVVFRILGYVVLKIRLYLKK